jgi:hypothetical protein
MSINERNLKKETIFRMKGLMNLLNKKCKSPKAQQDCFGLSIVLS